MDWIPAAVAIRLLGVQRATLYTYASRGWVRTRRLDGRRKLYHRGDVERLRERADAHHSVAARASQALAWGEPVLTTRISGIDRDGPYYRGVPAVDLLDRPLAEVAALLWATDVHPWPAPLPGSPTLDLRTLRRRIDTVPVHDDPFTTARLIVASTRAWTALPDTPVVRAALIAAAEHGLNASSFTARVVASTGADLPACIVAALAAFSGPRHGTMSLALADRLTTDELPADEPGFGHPLYPDGDPRGPALLERVDRSRIGRLDAHIRTQVATGRHPTLDVGLLAVARHEGLPDAAAPALFMVGRLLGWVAHALEQRADGRLLRPRGRYEGWLT